jgi:predicted RNA binding protein YcfA (HicA-like mRNA interferase family)
MPKLPCISPEELGQVLERCGFELEWIKGSHHFYHNPETKRSTVVPFHGNDVPKGLLNEILKAAGISWEELFKAMIIGTKSKRS